MKSPFICSHHIFPNPFNFCPYCVSKFESGPNVMGVHPKNLSKYRNLVNKQRCKKAVGESFPELTALLKGDGKCRF